MIIVGLTGSIGMGKSTVTAMFADEGAAVWNADDAVHRLYAPGGKGARAVAARFPDTIIDGGVDREKLSALVLDDKSAFGELETIIHPLVGEDRARFLEDAIRKGADIAVLDIPLLFEKNYENFFDAIVVVSAPFNTQRARVLGRDGMTPEKFEAIVSKQTPDGEKRRRADFVIDTGAPIEQTRREVRRVYRELKDRSAI